MTRYLETKQFCKYVGGVGLLPNRTDGTIRTLLEFLERIGTLTPVARVRFPDEVARRWYRDRHPDHDVIEPVEADTERFVAASELRGWLYNDLARREDLFGPRDHPLDARRPEFEQFITRDFSREAFVPWKSFESPIARFGDQESRSADHVRAYYQPWQVFLMDAFLRSGVSVHYDLRDDGLASAALALDLNPEQRSQVLITTRFDARADLQVIEENRILFEVVSYFKYRCDNALSSHRADVDRRTSRLTGESWERFRQREAALAHESLERFDVEPIRMRDFVVVLKRMWSRARTYGLLGPIDAYQRCAGDALRVYQLATDEPWESVREAIREDHRDRDLDELFPDRLAAQRLRVQASLANWILPLMQGMASELLPTAPDLIDFCAWIEENELFQIYAMFERLGEQGIHNDEVAEGAHASEVVVLASLVEFMANIVLSERNEDPRVLVTLIPKLRKVFAATAPTVSSDLGVPLHQEMTRTKASGAFAANQTRIEGLTVSGPETLALKALLRFVLIRNETLHNGVDSFSREAIYSLLENLLVAALLIWKAR